ncbi:MAG: hypothetical protein ACI9KE_006743 [Polyangiales bacterium]|jgi:hypothetical protein
MKRQILGALLITLTGCGAGGVATMVRTSQTGGELELSGPYLARTADAVVLMATHCDGFFAVLDEHAEGGLRDTPAREQTHLEFVCGEEATELRAANSRE